MSERRKLEQLLEDFERKTIQRQGGVRDFTGKEVFLYGAGNVGGKLGRCLKQNGIAVTGFLDRNLGGSVKEGIPVYDPEDEFPLRQRERAVVILSALFSKTVCAEIKAYLKQIGFRSVLGLHEIDFPTLAGREFCKTLFIGSYPLADLLDRDRDDALRALDLFQTEKEKELYFQYIKAYLCNDFSQFDEPYDADLQYLAHDISERANYSTFVDCGAFDGDTLRNLRRQGRKIENYIAFEPQNDVCRALSAYVNEVGAELKSAVIFPCGVHDKIEQMYFSSSAEAASTGRLDAAGTESVQCAAIDDVLYGFAPTFIKMDIEGAEPRALLGARRTIQRCRPQLAICVYHDLSHIWRIPLRIKEIYPGYRLYLRNYQFMGLETVVYAFPDHQ